MGAWFTEHSACLYGDQAGRGFAMVLLIECPSLLFNTLGPLHVTMTQPDCFTSDRKSFVSQTLYLLDAQLMFVN